MHDTQIAGIPCSVEVEYVSAYQGASEGGQKLEPDEPAYYEIVKVFKIGGGGKHMAWLEAKLTQEDRDRINQEAMED